jgi:hypothetical protein
VAEEESSCPENTELGTRLTESKGCTPIFMKNTAVQYFIDVQKLKGKALAYLF